MKKEVLYLKSINVVCNYPSSVNVVRWSTCEVLHSFVPPLMINAGCMIDWLAGCRHEACV